MDRATLRQHLEGHGLLASLKNRRAVCKAQLMTEIILRPNAQHSERVTLCWAGAGITVCVDTNFRCYPRSPPPARLKPYSLKSMALNTESGDAMRTHIISLSALTALGFALLPSTAISKQKSLKDQLVGTWTLVSANQVSKEGVKSDRWGPNPRGRAIFEANGRYSFMIFRTDIPKFASNNMNRVTAEEAKQRSKE